MSTTQQMNVHRLWSHETKLSAEASSAGQARAFVSLHLRDHDLPHLVDDIESVVSELATNAMVHAQTPFTVILIASEGTVVLEVADGSRAEPSLVVARSLDTSGRGVAIVQALSRDEWSPHDQGVKKTPAREGAAGAPVSSWR